MSVWVCECRSRRRQRHFEVMTLSLFFSSSLGVRTRQFRHFLDLSHSVNCRPMPREKKPKEVKEREREKESQRERTRRGGKCNLKNHDNVKGWNNGPPIHIIYRQFTRFGTFIRYIQIQSIKTIFVFLFFPNSLLLYKKLNENKRTKQSKTTKISATSSEACTRWTQLSTVSFRFSIG